MKRSALIFLLALLCAVPSLRADDEKKPAPAVKHAIRWAKSYDEALAAAKKTERPILADFEAEWCGWCKKLDRDTYGNEKVIRFVNQFFVAVKIDTDHQPDLAKKFNVKGLPSILVLGSDGSELQRLTGYRPPERFLEELKKSTEASASLKELKAAAEKSPDDLDAQRAYARAVFAAGNSKDALAALRRSLEKHADEPTLVLELADMLRVSDQPEEARKLYEKLLADRSKAGKDASEKLRSSAQKAQLPLARLYINGKSYEKSLSTLSAYLSAVKRTDENAEKLAEAHLLRAYAHSVLDQPKESMADLARVIEIAPESELAHKAAYILELVGGES